MIIKSLSLIKKNCFNFKNNNRKNIIRDLCNFKYTEKSLNTNEKRKKTFQDSFSSNYFRNLTYIGSQFKLNKIQYKSFKNMVEKDNKRVIEGTEHSITSHKKIGGDFVEQQNAPFIEERSKIFDKLYEEQKKFLDTVEKKPIKITLKDGKVVEGKALESTPLTIAKANLPKSILGNFIVAKVKYTNKVVDFSKGLVDADADLDDPNKVDSDFELWDLDRGLEGDCLIEYLTFDDDLGRHVFWHSSAHILGLALEKVYGAKLCIGPPIKEGFYYDAYMGSKAISEEKDYKNIEQAAEFVIKSNVPYQRLTLSKEQALELFGDNPFKVQLITNKVPNGGKTTAYKCGNLIDLCMGPHLVSTGVAKNIKVYKNSGCYWLGNCENDSLQRVYGITFPDKAKMEQWVKIKEEEARRDHRNIGKKHGYFMFHDLSPGSCFFFPDGAHLYNKLMDFMRKEYKIRGFQEVISPNMFNIRLWKTSGHYKNYHENIFTLNVENQGFGLKPMNCPGHCLMFDSKVRSYKELPMRFADFGVLHRNEVSGALSGLTRVRRFQQDDAHIFIEENNISEEITSQLDFLDYIYTIFGFKYELYLSTKPDKALGDDALWEKAEKALGVALDTFTKQKNMKWTIDPKGGAFYGPKIDVKLFDALGRSHQCGTIQLDFQLPIRFNLQYRTQEQFDKEGEEGDKENKKEKKDNKKEKKEKKGKEEKPSEEEIKAKKQKEEEEKREKIRQLIEQGKMEKYCKDCWDPEDFYWEEHDLKPGFKRPVIVHRAILGSVERMLAILIEQTEGKWPFWLSPKQAVIYCVSEKFLDYAKQIKQRLNNEGYRVDVDSGKGTLNKKIAVGQTEGYNYILVVGAKEQEDQLVDVRDCRAPKEKMELGKFSISKLLGFFKSLEPAVSNAEIELRKKGLADTVLSDIESLEPTLVDNLYLGGDAPNDSDRSYFEKIEKGEFILPEKTLYPNINKWYKLMFLNNK